MKQSLKNTLNIFLILIITITNCFSVFASNITTTEQTTQPTTQSPSLPDNPPSFEPSTPESEDVTPKIRMGGDGNITVEPGKENKVDIPIINTSQSYAYNLLIQARPEKDAPFSIKFLNNSNRKNIIERVGSTTANMVFVVDKNAPTGTYPVTLEFSYTAANKASFNNSDTLYVKIENGDGSPNVVLNNFSSSKDKVIMGEEFSINTTLENLNKVDAKNLSVQVLGLDESNITLVGNSNSTYIQNFEGTLKKPMTFKFATSKLTKEGSNKITFKLTYYDLAAKEYTKEFQYYILVAKDKDSTNKPQEPTDIKITSLVAPKETLGVNQSGTFTLKVKNDGKTEAKNIKITAKIPEGLVPTTSNIVVLPSIPVGSEKTVSFSVAPTMAAKTQAYSVGFAVEYTTITDNDKPQDDQQNQTPTTTTGFEQYAGVSVFNPEADKKPEDEEKKKTSVPKIIISRYESVPMIVEAGKPFDLSMTFKNTHSVKTVKNIKLYLTVDDKTEEKGTVFAPDNSSTTFYIDQIPPNGEVQHTFDLFTVPDAKPRSYTVNVNFEYEDEEANEFKTTELVGINVKQQSKLETSEIKIQENGNLNEPIYAGFQLYNTGKVTLSNLKIEFDGDGFDTSTSTAFIGNLEPGASDYYDGNFMPIKTGQQNLKLKISYDDTDGQKVERVEEYKINIQDAPEVDPTFNENMPPDQPEKQPISKKKIAVIAVAVVVVIVLVISLILYLKRRAKLKKEFDFND